MIVIIILIVINSYIIIKDNMMITMMKIMFKIKIIENIKKKYSPSEWSFLTKTITLTTNKTLITDKTLTGERKKNKKQNQKNK